MYSSIIYFARRIVFITNRHLQCQGQERIYGPMLGLVARSQVMNAMPRFLSISSV